MDPANRMKPLDVVKVLMGIESSRECVRRFRNEALWARRKEYDYLGCMEVSNSVVQSYYLE